MENRTIRQVVIAIVALIGGYLLYLSANPASSAATAFGAFVAGLLVFVGVAWVLLRTYRPGTDLPSDDEVNIGEWRFIRFLRYGKQAAPFFLGLRLFLAWEWIEAGWHKVTDPQWVGTGEALLGYWTRAVAVPEQGRPPITYPAYRSIIQFMIDSNWYTWFADMIAWGEVLVGVGFLVGGLVGFAAFFALLMNFSFLFAGSTSSNPTLVILQVILILGWRVAGYWGVDRFLLPRVGTPWALGHQVDPERTVMQR